MTSPNMLVLPGDRLHVVPVAGPPGPQGETGDTGPQGEQGPAGDSEAALSYIYSTSTPAMVHQIHHGLAFNPAGIVCQDVDGSSMLGWSVTYPSLGITEVSFGADVTPTIYLS